ncbi:hypothetical protein H131_12458 [Lysinibacillus sphaericus OT4b.31]|uniref:Uncharacterized protein n=1 Tax=Lysinibacillus sphaericus OT4b.31 TaxID=1285586 RepID=R7ZE60_LYSSH|nr:hypothetical protein H131_12458 [Lysinibacillus sphaericus OT4b.31]
MVSIKVSSDEKLQVNKISDTTFDKWCFSFYLNKHLAHLATKSNGETIDKDLHNSLYQVEKFA